eukprot:CAMPEP_0169091278 /NCGR_PEP_ID=MMETSP1015-20121227/16276_1 /TAXON_ID=342587 /ORGANISM="Karlodinium micrum, Strain CCMP2283" /LENGTH=611 /DNA_ID=CAMNT_0009151757 /DNA_START=124 /DNA_END=1959 /DNA_ORIENTATION=+
MDEEELKSKGGEDLFKELLRLLPTADIQDYYKNGVWQDSTIRLDIRILEGHRQEAGSPEPIPLEEVQMPELPKATSNVPLAIAAKAGLLKPMSLAGRVVPKISSTLRPATPLTPAQVMAKAAILRTKGLLRPGSGKLGINFPKAVTKITSVPKASGAAGISEAVAGAPVAQKIPPPKAVGKTIPHPKQRLPLLKALLPSRLGPLAKAAKFGKVVPKLVQAPPKDGTATARSTGSSAGVSSSTAGGALSSDLRQITAFISKWGLDQTKAKLALAKLSPQKRSYIVANFKNPSGSNGAAPIAKLEQYINQCERLNSWNSPGATRLRPQVAGARTIPAPATKPVPSGARELAARAPSANVAAVRKNFVGVGAKIAALRKPTSAASSTSASSAPAKVSFVRTMAPKAAPGRTIGSRLVTPRPSGKGMTVKPPASAPGGKAPAPAGKAPAPAGKGTKPISGASAIGQGVKRPVPPASAPWQSDPKRQRLSPAPSSGSWPGSSAPHAVGKAANASYTERPVPHTAAKAASVVAPKAKLLSPSKPAASTVPPNRQSSWSGSGKGSSWDSGGKSTGKNSTSSNASWGTGGAKNNWSQGGGGKASSKQGTGMIKSLLRKY